MRSIELLVTALEYIEQHLRDEIKTEDVAAVCYCSKSTLEKLFRRVHGISVHAYWVPYFPLIWLQYPRILCTCI